MKFIKGYTGYIICLCLLLSTVSLSVLIYEKYKTNNKIITINTINNDIEDKITNRN